MEPSPFARCRQFLNYHSLAKWLSIASSIGTAVLFVGLIVLLGFFIDLIVNNGEIPSYYQLPESERLHFLSEIIVPDDKEARAERVALIEHELHDRQEVGPVDIPDELLIKRFSRGRIGFPREACRPRRTAHHLGHLGEGRWRQVVGHPLLLEPEQALLLQEHLVEIGTQGRDDPNPAAGEQPFEDGRPQQSWRICPAKSCKQLHDGRIWKCAPVAYLGMQKVKYDLSEKWDPYLRYRPLDPSCSDRELDEFLALEDEPVCSMCSAVPRGFALPNPMRNAPGVSLPA